MEGIAPKLSLNETRMLRLMTLCASPKRQFFMQTMGPKNPFVVSLNFTFMEEIKEIIESLVEKGCIEISNEYDTSARLIKIKKVLFEM